MATQMATEIYRLNLEFHNKVSFKLIAEKKKSKCIANYF